MQSAHEDWSQLAAEHSASVLLRTARPDPDNQCSFLFMDPLQIISTSELDEIPAVFESTENALRAGYWVAGFLSYEAGYHFEPRAANSPAAHDISGGVPLAWFGVYREPLVRNEHDGAWTDSATRNDEADQAAHLTIDIAIQAYRERIRKIRRLIEAGDLYQANFTVKGSLTCNEPPAALFEKIMASQPVAYGALIHTGDAHILSASPELFFRRHADCLTVRPMKGTAPRGRDLEEDARMSAWLAADEKNRAENVMIVDLMRNDLGRICKFGTVEVTELFAVERYPDLLQMTSTVRGELKKQTTYYEIFRSLFPCGSITGAPKVRTMQAIRELEGEPRGIA
ncbi:MAG TPA: chorismate-binding protein, partial [Acidobacteriaceae bacterium]|nr:chorismate-binding protein [Acidobacteriaceae bacterium]